MMLSTWTSLALGLLGQQPEPAPSVPGATPGPIRGVVLDERGRPVESAFVLVVDARSGLPLGRRTRRPFLARVGEEQRIEFDPWLFARTDERGGFAFDEVPAGRYRLTAQSFPDAPEGFDGPLNEQGGIVEHGGVVLLCGATEAVEVPSAVALAVTIAPLGDATFVYERDSSSNDGYLFLSRAPLAADPVLGFLGFQGPFLTNAIGWSRMQAGGTTVRGLPSGTICYSIFAMHGEPRFGAGTFTAESGAVVRRDTNLVGGWKDAIQVPPERLRALTAEIAASTADHGEKRVEAALLRGREGAWPLAGSRPEDARIFDLVDALRPVDRFERAFLLVDAIGPLEREVDLDSGTRATVADILAAGAYARLAR